MTFDQLVSYIVAHYDSCYLLPLSQRYGASIWNKAMREAWRNMRARA